MMDLEALKRKVWAKRQRAAFLAGDVRVANYAQGFDDAARELQPEIDRLRDALDNSTQAHAETLQRVNLPPVPITSEQQTELRALRAETRRLREIEQRLKDFMPGVSSPRLKAIFRSILTGEAPPIVSPTEEPT